MNAETAMRFGNPARGPHAPVLAVEHLVKRFGSGRGRVVHAVNDVSFAIRPGEVLGMAGESGSGKSTIGRCVLRLIEPTSGSIRFAGEELCGLRARKVRPLRARMQMVFQDPWTALNPRMRVGDLVGEPLLLHGRLPRSERRDRVEGLLGKVRLSPDMLGRFPTDLSGGQLQRVCIARAIATGPALIVLDEPTSSLDLSVRAGILELLAELRAETGTAMLFISHDLGTLQLISDRIMVLYLGRTVEEGPARRVFEAPAHPYTQALLSAHLPPDPTTRLHRHILEGEVPSPLDLPPGCFFASRCPVALPTCTTTEPPFFPLGEAARAACLRIADGGNRLPEASRGAPLIVEMPCPPPCPTKAPSHTC